MSTDNRLPITKGEWIFDESNMKIKGSGDIEGMTVIANVSPKMDFSRGMTTQFANAQLIADAGTTYNKCHTLPSELLEILEEIANDCELWEKLSTKYQSKIYSAITTHS